MRLDEPHYRFSSYLGETLLSSFVHPVDGPCDEVMIRHMQHFHQAPGLLMPSGMTMSIDLHYCADHLVTFVGTMVTNLGEAVWHAGGVAGRIPPAPCGPLPCGPTGDNATSAATGA